MTDVAQPLAKYRAPRAGVETFATEDVRSDGNADVTWEGPEYAALQPIVFGYATFEALFAACEVGLFAKLADQPGMTLDEVTSAIKLPRHSTRMLLLTCSSIDLVVKNGDRYYNSYISEKILIPGRPKCAIPFIRSGQYLQYKGFYHLLDALKQEKNVGVQEYSEGHLYDRVAANPELEPVLYEVMAAIWELSHPGLNDIPEFRQVRHLLDVGGGNAVVASHLHDKYPHLRISVLDRPSACERAKKTIAAKGKQEFIDTIPGDMYKTPFPAGPDALIYSHILEELSPDDRQRLIEKAYAALPSGGRFFAFDFTCRDDERGDLYGARISLYFLVNASGSGMAFPPKDYVSWFESAGFTNVKAYTNLPFEHSLIVGIKP